MLYHCTNSYIPHCRVMGTVAEKCKLAKLLCMADTGSLGQFDGRSIGEIDISPGTAI